MPRIARTTKETLDFLLDNATESNECLISHLKPGNGGYVQINVQGEILSAHVFVFRECVGNLTRTQVVRHTCDTRNCINPKHLIAGTQQENIMDAVTRNRHVSRAKSQYREAILAEQKKGLSYSEIAARLNLPYNTVRNHASPFGAYYKEGSE